MAESIESDDATTWTVTLKDGWTFHDGTPVTAQSFVDAWNYTALSTNARGLVLLRERRGLRRPAGARPTTPATSSPRPRGGDERPRGRRRPDVHRHADRAVRAVPGHRRLQRLLPAARVASSTTPRPCGELPIGNGPFQADEEFVARSGHHARPGTTTTAVTSRPGGRGRVPGLHRHQHRLHRHPGRQPRHPGQRSRRTRSPPRPTSSVTATSRPRRRRSPTSASRPTTRATPTSACGRPSRWRSTGRRSPTRSSTAPASRRTR